MMWNVETRVVDKRNVLFSLFFEETWRKIALSLSSPDLLIGHSPFLLSWVEFMFSKNGGGAGKNKEQMCRYFWCRMS
jgi:hypothetical protein